MADCASLAESHIISIRIPKLRAFYIYKDVPTVEDSYQRDVYLEILGEAGHSPWDNRYEILLGDLLNPPVIAKEILLASVNTLREELHAPEPFGARSTKPTQQATNVLIPTPWFVYNWISQKRRF